MMMPVCVYWRKTKAILGKNIVEPDSVVKSCVYSNTFSVSLHSEPPPLLQPSPSRNGAKGGIRSRRFCKNFAPATHHLPHNPTSPPLPVRNRPAASRQQAEPVHKNAYISSHSCDRQLHIRHASLLAAVACDTHHPLIPRHTPCRPCSAPSGRGEPSIKALA